MDFVIRKGRAGPDQRIMSRFEAILEPQDKTGISIHKNCFLEEQTSELPSELIQIRSIRLGDLYT